MSETKMINEVKNKTQSNGVSNNNSESECDQAIGKGPSQDKEIQMDLLSENAMNTSENDAASNSQTKRTAEEASISDLNDNHNYCEVPFKKPKLNDTQTMNQNNVIEYLLDEHRRLQEVLLEHSLELIFLQTGGSMVDYFSWRKRQPSQAIIDSLRINTFSSDKELQDLFNLKSVIDSSSTKPSDSTGAIQLSHSTMSPSRLSNVISAVTSISSTTTSQLITSTPTISTHTSSISHVKAVVSSPSRPSISPVSTRVATRQHSISSFYDSAIGSQEQIVERAKQEAYVMQRIAELRKEGMWSSRRLPKVQEPLRCKAHWDYLLEEMAWLATDFAQERKWKKAAAKKCARMVMKYHQDKQCQAEKAEKEELMRLKKIASNIAKQIKQFWGDIEKVVEARQEARLKEKRKKLHDMHLNFIVDKADQYTEKLTQKLTTRTVASGEDSGLGSQSGKVEELEDSEFEPELSESDDEETIAKEEKEVGLGDVKKEVEMLKEEGEIPIEELLPPEILSRPASPLIDDNSDSDEKLDESIDKPNKDDKDNDFEIDDEEDMEDDEQTIEEQEKVEKNNNYQEELKELESDANLSIEELIQKYSVSESQSQALDSDDDSEDEMSQDDNETEYEEESFSDDENENEMSDVGMEFLICSDSEFEEKSSNKVCDGTKEKGSKREITDIAAGAESLQPKGNTLSAVQVCTKVPFLLKHTLREYQHIGLDWLVAMHDKKLNGILADEMGLGKTIQTIALLAHLACEKGIWGPHLIVVPTSVMLNWEMEFKKWCPAFKILTYYGSPKERKLKRQGWTKPNQFHVCITSYKLVIQDHFSFRRKKWRYLILDEAQHIKNFKSQRWQMLLNFNTSRRLLLTGTPLQNNLMELWSLMHFLMPNVFASHKEFKDWFVNPVSGMIEGNQELNENLIRRLHKVLRPFLLRRLKCDVEKQLPKKYEHVVMCRLSKRQRFLYEEFMSLGKTKETLASGNFLSVINILMQLRKVCNHPDLFDPRPTISPFMMEGITYHVPSLVTTPLDYDPFKHVDLNSLNLILINLSFTLSAFAHHRIKRFMASPKLIEEIDCSPEPPPRCPRGKIRLHIKSPTKPLPLNTNLPSRSVGSGSPAVITRLPNSEPKFIITSNSNLATQINSVNQASGDGTKISIPLGRLIQTPAGQQILLRTTAANQTTLSQTIVQQSQLSSNANTRQFILTRSPHIPTGLTNGQKEPIKQVTSPIKQMIQNNSLKSKQQALRKEKLSFLARINSQRCNAAALYASDLIEMATFDRGYKFLSNKLRSGQNVFTVGNGRLNCYLKSFSNDTYETFWNSTSALHSIVKTPENIQADLHEIMNKFVCIVAGVFAPQIQLHASHYPPSKTANQDYLNQHLHNQLTPSCNILHTVNRNMRTQFPELRLIQYDCGKLQTLDKLLWDLKTGGHRALIFTQMSRMLDIFEQFLNYHGHTYLRLDGTTKIEQRQALMERFNADKRIFCFILSTRSGGIGVNLTGADTVIFYDSDWNPTMDAQAQDRCHRIGQTRDVHIYRLISEKTVEENILKKANQKRLLGDVAIEGGNFTTAFFKRNAIQELFGIDLPTDQSNNVSEANPSDSLAEELGENQIQQALCTAEEENDVAAAKIARAEAAAEFAEFDESIPIDNENKESEEKSLEEEKIDELIEQLKPVERYAMQIMESISESFSLENLKQEEEEIEALKKEWEMGRLVSEKEEEEKRVASLEKEKETSLTCHRDDAYNQVYISYNGLEQMPIWTPPTPPQDENDLYIDHSLGFLYEHTIMPESLLPPIYVPKESNKRLRLDSSNARKQKIRKEEGFSIPRSLFDRPSNAIIKLRRELVLQKMKGNLLGNDSAAVQRTLNSLGASCLIPQFPKIPPHFQTGIQYDALPQWAIHEDWSIIQVLQYFQDLPLNLLILSPGHIPNWDLVSDVVNAISCNYRSPKYCKHHYETTIISREEGKTPLDTPKQKQKKQVKLAGQTQATIPVASTSNQQTRPVKTSQLFLQDNNLSFSQLCNQRFETIKQIANKRTPTLKPPFINPSPNKTKHLTLLSESGINYEQPLTPMQVAQNRSDRITREKQKAAEQQQQLASVQRQQHTQQQQMQVKQQQIQSQQIKAILPPANVQGAQATQQQFQQAISAKVAALSKSPTNSAQMTSLTKALSQTATSANQGQHTIQQPIINQISVNPTAAVSSDNTTQGVAIAQHQAGSVVSVATIGSPSQKLIAPVSQVGTQQVTRFAQSQAYKQLLLQRQQQQLQLQRQGQPIQIQHAGKQATIGVAQQQTRFQIASTVSQPIQQSLIATSGVKTATTITGTIPVAIPVASTQQQRISTSSSPNITQQSLIATSAIKTGSTNVNTGTLPVALPLSATQQRILTTTANVSAASTQQVSGTQSLIAATSIKSASNVTGTLPVAVPVATSQQQRILTTSSSGKPTQQIITRTFLDSVQMAQLLKGQRSIVNTQSQQGTTQILHLQQQPSQQQQQQQTQQIIQNPVILVKTMPTPSTLAQSITIPVSAVTMSGMNIFPAQTTKISQTTPSTSNITLPANANTQLRHIQLLQKRPQQITQQQSQQQPQQSQQQTQQTQQIQLKQPSSGQTSNSEDNNKSTK